MAADVEQLRAAIVEVDPLLRHWLNLQRRAVSHAEADITSALQLLDPPIEMRERALVAVPILVALARGGILAGESAHADLKRFAALPSRRS